MELPCHWLHSPNITSYSTRDLMLSTTPVPFFFFHHTTCESTCDTLASSAANQGDNTVSVAQGGLPKLCYHPGWRLMRLGYRTCFHTLYDEKKKKKAFTRCMIKKKKKKKNMALV